LLLAFHSPLSSVFLDSLLIEMSPFTRPGMI
jgi:hypothetical protein